MEEISINNNFKGRKGLLALAILIPFFSILCVLFFQMHLVYLGISLIFTIAFLFLFFERIEISANFEMLVYRKVNFGLGQKKIYSLKEIKKNSIIEVNASDTSSTELQLRFFNDKKILPTTFINSVELEVFVDFVNDKINRNKQC